MSTLSLNKQHSDKMVGTYIPTNLNVYLTLFSIARNVSKSKLFRNMINKWRETQPLEDELIDMIVHRVQLQWKSLQSVNHKANFEDFVAEVRMEFYRKELPIIVANAIINKLTP